MLRVVAATRSPPAAFPQQTLLGRSLARVAGSGWAVEVACNNAAGLPDVYNAALARAADSDVIAFVHDDVWLDGWFLPVRLREALERFAVVGVAGNRRRVSRQPSWALVDRSTWDTPENLSGSICHLKGGQQ